jgi:hypothetical protein
MVALEESMRTFGKDPDLPVGATERMRPGPSSSVSTTQGSSHSLGPFGLDLEAAIVPVLRQASQPHLAQIEALPLDDRVLPVYEKLPPPNRFASLRYTIFNVYRRLFTLVFLANLAAFIWVILKDASPLNLINAAAANILALGLARQPLIINLMFKIFGAIPRTTPLLLRRWCAKIYYYGGVHSGCGIASLVWYFGFIVLLTHSYIIQRHHIIDPQRAFIITKAMLALSHLVLLLLFAIIIVAHPKIRSCIHDYFELTHRFCGWVLVALFWPLLLLASHATAQQSHRTLSHILVRFPAFWILILTTLAIIHPWLLLRRIRVTAEYISPHAIRLHFSHKRISFGHAISVSKHPLHDWHSFACFPDEASHPDTPVSKDRNFSVLVSKAGDWTADTIMNPPTHLWVRGVPTYGFARMMRIFSRILLVTTGSGIGPSLSFLRDPNRPAMRVIWQTKKPLETFGQGILDLLAELDPQAVLLETGGKGGRRNMLPMVVRMVAELKVEAVCVISNPVVTRGVVFGCEARGIPAFGAIFDS